MTKDYLSLDIRRMTPTQLDIIVNNRLWSEDGLSISYFASDDTIINTIIRDGVLVGRNAGSESDRSIHEAQEKIEKVNKRRRRRKKKREDDEKLIALYKEAFAEKKRKDEERRRKEREELEKQRKEEEEKQRKLEKYKKQTRDYMLVWKSFDETKKAIEEYRDNLADFRKRGKPKLVRTVNELIEISSVKCNPEGKLFDRFYRCIPTPPEMKDKVDSKCMKVYFGTQQYYDYGLNQLEFFKTEKFTSFININYEYNEWLESFINNTLIDYSRFYLKPTHYRRQETLLVQNMMTNMMYTNAYKTYKKYVDTINEEVNKYNLILDKMCKKVLDIRYNWYKYLASKFGFDLDFMKNYI